jgi:hypothetical protein
MLKYIGPAAAKILGFIFAALVFALVVLMSFGTLGRIFPNDIITQAGGLIVADIGALLWLVLLVKASRGTAQRAIALLLFLLDAILAAAMAGADAMMSGQTWAEIPAEMGSVVLYAFVGVLVANLFAMYAHHLCEPDLTHAVHQELQADRVLERALNEADKLMDARIAELAQVRAQQLFTETLMALDMQSLGGKVERTVIDADSVDLPPTDTANPTAPASQPKRRR